MAELFEENQEKPVEAEADQMKQVEEAVSKLLNGESVVISHPGLSKLDVVIDSNGHAIVKDGIANTESEYKKGSISLVDEIIKTFESGKK